MTYTPEIPPRYCDYCGTSIPTSQPTKKRFCSNKCRSQFHIEKRQGFVLAMDLQKLTPETERWAIDTFKECRGQAYKAVGDILHLNYKDVKKLEKLALQQLGLVP